MESKKINQLATELAPELSDLTIIGDPTTGISKKITLSQMASLFTGTVEEYASLSAFPLVGTADTIYIALDTNVIYRWNTETSAYVELSPNIVTSLVFNDSNGFDGTISLVGSTATLTITTALTQGSVPFIGSSGALTQDNANLFFDDTNNRLGINTNSPTTALDVFGSGIIGRINGTSTNNAFLGFASAGSNKWSIGNVQSDHRFRIYNEATTSELVSVLQTGEFGIGIANPTTKLHIDGGASALIANLDANVSVAKSISFRSDNSNRINIEVSGTESGSNAGADFFIRRYSDAGSLIDTPFSLTRSTGYSRFANKLFVSAAGNAPSLTWSGINDLAITNNVFASQALITNNSTLGNYSTHSIGKTRGTLASPTAVANGEIVGNVLFFGHDGTNYISGNEIVATVDGTVASGIVPLSMTFRTRNASGTMADRLVLSANGNFGVGGAANERFGVIGTAGVLGFSRFTDGATGALFIGVNSGTPFIHSNNSTLGLGASGSNNFTPTMTLSSGSVGIGTTTPAALLDVNGNLNVSASGNIFTASTSGIFFNGVGSFSTGIYNDGSANLRFSANGAERGRYTATGFLKAKGNASNYISLNNSSHEISTSVASNYNTFLVSQTATDPYGLYIWYSGNSPNNNLNEFLACADSTQAKAYIYSNGNLANRNGSYGTISSDIRLKENIANATSKLQDILKLNVVNFNFKDDTDKKKQIGFIAQEFQQVFPSLVSIRDTRKYDEEGNLISGLEDALGVNVGMEFAILVKAIQEQQKQIEELKALINK